jgi:hypothetical protein
MLNRGIVACAIANAAGLFIIHVSCQGVRQVGAILEVGPDATPDEIATAGSRRELARKGVFDERQVLLLVESYGYEYVPAPSGWRPAAVSAAS